MISKKDLPQARKELPYGLWTTDEHEVLFNRSYHPIWQRNKNNYQDVAPVKEHAWIPFKTEQHFFTDSNPPWKSVATERRCKNILNKFVSSDSITEVR